MKWLREVKKVEELNIIYDAFKNCLNEKPEDYPDDFESDPNEFKIVSTVYGRSFMRVHNVYDKYNNLFDVQSRFFSYLLGFRDFTKFPKYLTDEAFDSLKSKSFYHGFKEFEHGASLLSDWNYHYGQGWVFGTYFSDSKNEASEYAREPSQTLFGEESKVLEAKLVSSNGIENKNLFKISELISDDNVKIDNLNLSQETLDKISKLKEFIKTHDYRDKDFDRFKKFILKTPLLAVYLGFDYIYYESVNDTEHIVALNRSSFAVPEREFLKFTQNSKSYKGDSIDLEKI